MPRTFSSRTLVRTPHGELYVSRTGPVMVFQEAERDQDGAEPHVDRAARLRRSAVAWISTHPSQVRGVTCFRLYLSDLTEL